MTDEVSKVLELARNNTSSLYLLQILEQHKAVIYHGGDQRDPITGITCACQKNSGGYGYRPLGASHYLHLFEVLRPVISSMITDTGR